MRDIVSSFTATLLIQLANVGSGIFLARILQPDGRGELALVMLWPTLIAALGILGVHEAIAYHAAQRRHATAAILRNSLLLGAALSLLLVPAGLLVLHFVLAGQPDEVRSTAFLYIACIPLSFLTLFVASLFQGMQRFAEWNLLRTAVHVAYFALIPIFHALGWNGVRDFAIASLLSFFAAALAGLGLCVWRGWLKSVPAALPADAAEASLSTSDVAAPSVMGDMLRYGVTVHFGAAIALIAERLDQLIISVTLSAVDLGLFVVATTIARLPLLLSYTLGTLAFPKMAATENEEERVSILGRYVRFSVLVVIPCVFVLMAAMPWILAWLFGTAFTQAAPIAWVLVIGAIPLSLKFILGTGLKALNRAVALGQTELVTLGLSAAALAVLVPLYGLMGAAAASVIAQGGAMIFALARIRAFTGLSAKAILLPRRSDFAAMGYMLAVVKKRVSRQEAEKFHD